MHIPSFLKILPLTWTGHSPPFQQPISAPDQALYFTHRHAFVAQPRLPNSFAAPGGTQRPPQILFNDVLIPSPPSLTNPRSEDYTAAGFNPARLRTRKQLVKRPKSKVEHQIARKARRNDVEWDDADVVVPDMEHRETLLELAKVTGNAYALPGSKDWYDLDARWNSVRALFSLFARADCCDRAIHLVGKKTQTASEGISSSLQITVPSFFPSKAHRCSCKAQQRSATSSMITYSLVVVAPMWTMHGDLILCVIVASLHGSAAKPVSRVHLRMRSYSTT